MHGAISIYVDRDRAVLAAITSAADAGAPCPANGQLAAALGLPNPASASQSVRRLEAAGLLTVERSHRTRIVTVTRTGKSTSKPLLEPSAKAAARRDELAELVAEGATLAEVAELWGLSRQRIGAMWARICNDLGWVGD